MTLRATSASGTLVSYPPATASDRVSAVTLGYSQGSGTRFAVGTTAVTVTATDASGNASTCGFDVTVTRIIRQNGAEIKRENVSTHYDPEDKVTCTHPDAK